MSGYSWTLHGHSTGIRGTSGDTCALCRPALLTPIVRESAHWRTTINRSQNLPGKLLIALRHRAFRPDHFNCAFLQNQDRHVHLHVIPRYAGTHAFAGREFADPDWPDHYRPVSNTSRPRR